MAQVVQSFKGLGLRDFEKGSLNQHVASVDPHAFIPINLILHRGPHLQLPQFGIVCRVQGSGDLPGSSSYDYRP